MPIHLTSKTRIILIPILLLVLAASYLLPGTFPVSSDRPAPGPVTLAGEFGAPGTVRGLFAPAFQPLGSPDPTVTVSTGSVLLGETFTITATFENPGTPSGYGPTGYGPFIDLFIPHKGADGVFPTESTYDGISPASGTDYTASLDGESLTVITQTFPDDGGGTGCVDHPWGLDDSGFFLQVCGEAGDQLVSIELPYGSYTPGQPQLAVSIPARLSVNANPGTPLTIRGRGGFIFGATPMVDWCCTAPVDTTLVSDSGAPSTWASFSDVDPQVISFSKSTSAGEVATGPNSPATFTISVDLAPGQSFADIQITDALPNNLVYLGNLTTSPAADSVSQPTIDGLPHNGDEIILGWNGPIDSDLVSSITASFDYYIPEFDADGALVAPGTTTNTATLDQILWTPADGSPVQDLSGGAGPANASTSDRTITLGKGSSIALDTGPAGYTPGDLVRYTLTFEISDYYGFDELSLEDALPDGQHYFRDGTYFPTLAITRDGATSSYAIDPANLEVDCKYTGAPGPECDLSSGVDGSGETLLTFDLDQELVDQGADSQVLGDLVDDGGSAANATTTGTVVFYALILDRYTDTHPAPDDYIKMGDSFTNSANISGTQVDAATCNPGPCAITGIVSGNAASAGFTIGRSGTDKSIIALNGAYCNAGGPCSSVSIAAGDTITYRIRYDLLTGDYADLVFTDFLPLPIFHAEDPNNDGSSLGTWPEDTVNLIPDPGSWNLGPGDTRGQLPSVSISPHTADNYVRFSFGDYDDPANTSSTIEIYFTVRVTDQRFGDGLRMRNSVLQQDANSPGETSTTTSKVDLTLTEPVLVGEKSVVATDNVNVDPDPPIAAPIAFTDPGNPGAAPWNTGSTISSNYLAANGLSSGIDGIDGGDLVKFALVIENTGSGINGAYDIAIKDTLPAGYLFPGIGLGGFNLQVYRGDGLALDDGTGSGLEFLGPSGDATDFFDQGIRLRDPADNPAFVPSDPEYGQGLCQAHDASSGKNIIIVTYDLLVDPAVSPGSVLRNVGEIIDYTGEEGGTTYQPGPEENPQDSTVDVPELEKIRTGTGLIEVNNSDDQVVIGEEVYYQLTITFPEGSAPDTVVTDNLDSGLGFISQDSFTVSNEDTGAGDLDGGISFTGSSVPVITNGGRTITWDLGTLANSNDDNTAAETIIITYTAQTLNVAGNQGGTGLNNAVEISWESSDSDGNPVTATEGPVSADEVIVVEPQINVSKTVVVGGSGTSGDAGDSVEYTVTFTADPNRPPAYEADLSDFLPADIDFTSGTYGISSVSDTDGVLTTASFEITAGGELRLAGDIPIDMAPGRQVVVVLDGELRNTVFTGQTITNTAALTWSSETGDQNSGAEFGERDGSGGVNDYRSTNSAQITIITPSPGKTIVATSEDHTSTIAGIPRLSVGEIARYRIEVRLAEGTNNDLILRDNLPTGLVFLDDDTARVVFVADNPADLNSTTTADGDAPGITGPGAVVSGNETTLAGITPTVLLADANISNSLTGNNDNYASGTDVYFKLGDVFNGEADSNFEFAVVEFNVLVANLSGNQAGISLENSFSVFVDEDGDQNSEPGEIIDTSATNAVVVAEPSLSVTKTITAFPADAGDTIAYSLMIENLESGNNDATAFDLDIADTFDPYLTNLTIDSVATTQGAVCTGNGSGTTVYSDDGGSFTGQDLSFTAACLDQSQTITLTISAILADDVPAGYDLDNTADLVWTSLPGDKGTSPNPTGSDVDDTGTTEDESGGSRGERNGSGSPAVNDYADSGSVSHTLDVPVPVKSIVSTTASHTSESGDGSAGNPRDLAIGEIIRYRLAIWLPEGINTNLTLEDTLPAGFSYVDDSTVQVSFLADQDITEAVDLAGADNDALPPTFTMPPSRISVAGQDVTFDLGTLVNQDINDGNLEYAVIDFDVLVNNDANNNNTDLDDNSFEVYLDGTLAGTSNTITTRIVEPFLDIQKLASDLTPGYGETITYTLTVTHTPASAAEAFDIEVVDVIPAGLSYVPGSAGPAGWAPSFSAGDTLTWTCAGSCSLPLGSTAVLTYDVTMASPPAPPDIGDSFDNTVNLAWTSLDGADAGERTGDDNGGTEPYNDHRDSATESVTLTNPELRIAKDDGVAFYIPGSSVTYTIVVENIGNSGVVDALVEDSLPLETAPPNPPMVSSWDWVCTGSTGGASGCDDSLGLTGDFSDLVTLPAGSSITYTVTSNIFSSAEGDLINRAEVSTPAGVVEPTPGDNTATDTDVQESHADLSISKDDGVILISPGEVIIYTIVVSNTSPSDVSGALVEDPIPAEIASWSWDCTTVPPTGGASGCNGVVDSSLDFSDIIDLPVGSSITYLVTAQTSLSASGTLSNTATVSVPAGVIEDNPADNTATDVDSFPTHSKTLDSATHGVVTLPDVAIGEILTYEILLAVPNGSMTNLHLLDTLDEGLAFVDCLSINAPGLTTSIGTFADVCSGPTVSGASPAPEDAGRLVDFDFGTLTNATGGIVNLVLRYRVAVLDILANQSDSTPPLNNNAEWTWDSGSLSDQAVGVTLQEPDLTLAKSAFPITLYPGQLTTFTLVLEHTPGSQTSAYDVELTDIIPADLIYQPPIRHISGQAPTAIIDAGDPTLILRWDEFLNNGTNSVIEIDVMLDPAFNQRKNVQTIVNDASVSWTSLPGDFSAPQSIYNTFSTERFYDPLSNVDVYIVSDSASIRIPQLPDTGFAPGQVTELPLQTPEKAYSDLDGLRLDIPALEISLPIVSVPLGQDGYNLTWLGAQAGWLEGTAYPSWEGNTVITGHAYLSSGLPGPFQRLDLLNWGDEIVLYAHGYQYTYQVREKSLISGDDLSILGHREGDWLTLFTCKEYSDALGGYRWRQVVQAVLMGVKPIQ